MACGCIPAGNGLDEQMNIIPLDPANLDSHSRLKLTRCQCFLASLSSAAIDLLLPITFDHIGCSSRSRFYSQTRRSKSDSCVHALGMSPSTIALELLLDNVTSDRL